MTLDECTTVIGTFALTLRQGVDAATFRAYHRVLADVAPGLLEMALADLGRTGIEFLPSAPKVLSACEATRRRLLALHPYDGCPDCEDQRGFQTIMNAAGQKTVKPCPCKARHAEKLIGMGLGAPVAEIASEASGESEQVYPTLEQLPAPMRAQVAGMAQRKVLR